MLDDKHIKEEIAGNWDRASETYDDCYAHGIKSEAETREWLRLLDQLVEQGEPPRQVLDVGAGTGIITLLLARLGHHCKGLDLSENMLAVARHKAEAAGLDNVTFAVGDAEDTGEASGSYDVVINRHLVWTLPHPEQAIAEWKRVLRPGGKLIVLEGNWHYNRLPDRISVFFGRCLLSLQERRNAFSHQGDYGEELKASLPMLQSRNAKRLAQMLREAGFASVEVLPMTRVDRAEKAAMPLGYRLLNPHKRMAFVAVKAEP